MDSKEENVSQIGSSSGASEKDVSNTDISISGTPKKDVSGLDIGLCWCVVSTGDVS